MRSPLLGLGVLCGLFLVPPVAGAHVPQESTAHVSLRDGHVALSLDFDLVGVLEHEHGAALMLGQVSEEALAQALGNIKHLLEDETTLRLDGEPVRLQVQEFPSIDEIQRQAVQALVRSDLDPHGPVPHQEVRLQAVAAFPGAQSLSISLPAVMGRSFVTFDEPSSQFVEPGKAVTFYARENADDPDDPVGPCPTEPVPWTAIVFAFAGGALASAAGLRLYDPFSSGRP